ncbi:MAG: 5'/3'-nucleotidase SurE [Phycisphaerales bacterium]|nr:5'/3'-nucleotidase SurE [Planctomycetota bacterium]MBL6996918.1 5'/3'-nucleotidase SurE [Phycisphaerales bacterium]
MKILLTNDDGIRAPGIIALHKALQDLGELVVFAPETVQSATSHGITYTSPLMTQMVEVTESMSGVAVDGRPADCVKLALEALWEERFGEGTRPDLTISGMNSGSNVGINIIYSGTVAAAIESAFLGVPSIAVSLHLKNRSLTCYDRAAEISREVIDRVLENKLEPHEVININVPACETPDRAMPEIKVVEMNGSSVLGHYDKRVAPDGRTYYWAAGDGMAFTHTAEGSDVEALKLGHATVTPLDYVLSNTSRMPLWKDRLENS